MLLADEPTGNLDEGTRDEIIALLEKLWKDLGLTMVLVTHDTPVARRAQRVGLMRDGRLSIEQDTRPGREAVVTASQACPAGRVTGRRRVGGDINVGLVFEEGVTEKAKISLLLARVGAVPLAGGGRGGAVRGWRRKGRREIPPALGGRPGTPMPGKGEPHSSRMLKAPAAMVASIAVRRGFACRLEAGHRHAAADGP